MRFLKIIPLAGALIMGFSSAYAQKGGFPPNEIGKMLSLYLDIKNALIRDDGTTAKIKANELHYMLITQPDRGLINRQIEVLADNLPNLIDNSRGIGYTVDENTQRHYFAGLTVGMYKLVKGLRINTTRIYKQYCPINNCYWLSETPVITNPYYNYDGWAKLGKTIEVLPKSVVTD